MAQTKKQTAQQPAPVAEQAPAKKPTNSELFALHVERQFMAQTGGPELSERDKRLIRDYFIGIDRALKAADIKRLQGGEKKQAELPYTWQNVDMAQLAIDVVANARLGLDILSDNMIFAIPYMDRRAGKYRITLMKGYNGIRYEAERYAVTPCKNVRTELVYSTDQFKPIKKDAANNVESYVFRILQPFDRGEIIGGFAYIEYDDPTQNRLILMPKAEIDKRRPSHASADFWGGLKTVWQNGKKTEVQTEGWYAEMALKTLKREAYSAKHIPRDPAKIDEHYQTVLERESYHAEAMAKAEIEAEANQTLIDVTPAEEDQPEALPAPSAAADPEPEERETSAAPAAVDPEPEERETSAAPAAVDPEPPADLMDYMMRAEAETKDYSAAAPF